MPVQLDNSGLGTVTLTQNATFTATRTYTFPSAQGANTELLQSNGAGGLAWAANNGLGTAMASSLLTTGAGATTNISIINPYPAPTGSADMHLAFAAQTTPGATIWQAQVTDSTATGGNVRGGSGSALDLQKSRSAATQVASGDNSVILGGANNLNSGSLCVVAGGFNNSITTSNVFSICAIMGGSGNTMTGATTSASFNLILGGSGNTINVATGTATTCAAILGGLNNTLGGSYSIILGGYGQQGRGYSGALIWPTANALALSSTNSLCQTVSMTTLCEGNTAVNQNTTSDGTAITQFNTLANSNNAATFITGYIMASTTVAQSSRVWSYDMLVRKAATAASNTNIGGSAITVITGNLTTSTPVKVVDTTTGSSTISNTRSGITFQGMMNFMISHEVTY